MLVVNPAKRITIQNVLNHKWMKRKQREKSIEIRKSIPAIRKISRMRAPKRLKSEATKVVMKYVNSGNYTELIQAFQNLDVDNTGYITTNNLGEALSSIGMLVAKDELEEIIAKADYLKTGRLNYSEFLAATLDLKGKLTE